VIVAVLGGGNGALATAADAALGGHRVRVWRRQTAGLDPLRAGIALTSEGRQGTAKPECLTTDIGEAVAGADLVVVPVPAPAHEDVATRLAPHLTERHVVLLTPGTLGSYVMARVVAKAGGRLPWAFAETGTLPYLARKTGPAAVAAPVRAAHLPVGVFPGSRTDPVLARIAGLFPATRGRLDALDAALSNVGPVLHPPLVLLNAAAIDRGRFDIHAAGTTASPRRLIEAVDAERVAARRGLGYGPPHYEMATYYEAARASQGLYGAGAQAKLVASGLWSEELTFEHRYVAEDVVYGLSLLESAARTAGTESPAISGLLAIFGALLGRRLTGHGRDLDHLGLGELTLREVRAFFSDGWASPFWRKAAR